MDQRLFPSDFVDRFPDPFPPPFADTWGDDEYGLWAEFEIPARGGSGAIVQRLRWIELGTFLMGSPEDEPERQDWEGPWHVVTISRGLWLADTACAQGLWQVVKGTGPSRFKGPERPVESISWHDVQDFLHKLEALVPGCRADLPTEAEWEYACRAGTETPFSFGTTTTDEVNYNGSLPYAGGTKGKYREETVPVKSLPPNLWGLYEMHGNVWEWCADGLRTYDSEPQVDPRGPEGNEAPRALRGGSWVSIAGRSRSALRFAIPPGIADHFQGFRLCLRSIEPDRGRPGGRPPR